MAFTNKETKEINCKVLLFGTESSGRKSLLNDLKRTVNKEIHDDSFQSLKSSFSPFEFIPVSVGHIRDFNVKLHIYSISLEENFESTLAILLKGADIVSFVIDSGVGSLPDNINLLKHTQDVFKRYQMNLNAIPKIYVYNQINERLTVPIEILRREFNTDNCLEVELQSDKFEGSSRLLEKFSQLALDQLLRSI